MAIRAVIVDDDDDTVQVFSEYLKIKGMDVVGTGSNGKDAVELYQKFKPDVIILDMLMPEYDGVYAIKNIKTEFPNANIIVVSAYPEQCHIAEHEVTAVFLKPYKIDEIMDVIENSVKVST